MAARCGDRPEIAQQKMPGQDDDGGKFRRVRRETGRVSPFGDTRPIP